MSSFSFQAEQRAIYCVLLGSNKSIKEANKSLPLSRLRFTVCILCQKLLTLVSQGKEKAPIISALWITGKEKLDSKVTVRLGFPMPVHR